MTNRQHIETLKEPYRIQAFENTHNEQKENAEEYLSQERSSLATALSGAFTWEVSPQKSAYWLDVYFNPENYTKNEPNTGTKE